MITAADIRESRIALKLWKLGYGDIFAGITEAGEPKERLRQLIIARGIKDLPFLRREDGASVSLGEAFVETYGEPLELKQEAAA